jgi:hypothetical protein
MLRHAGTVVAEVARELERLEPLPLDARQRLSLDATVRNAAAELSGVVRLVDLLGVTFNLRATALELRDLLAQKRMLPGAPTKPVVLMVDFGTTPTLIGDAQVVLDLVLFAVASLERVGVTAPHLTTRVVGERVCIDLGGPPAEPRSPFQKVTLDVPVRTPLAREDEVLAAAARRARIELTTDLAIPRVTMLL